MLLNDPFNMRQVLGRKQVYISERDDGLQQ
jgi:hypothetical protein